MCRTLNSHSEPKFPDGTLHHLGRCLTQPDSTAWCNRMSSLHCRAINIKFNFTWKCSLLQAMLCTAAEDNMCWQHSTLSLMVAMGSSLDKEACLCRLPRFIPSAEKHCPCMTLNCTVLRHGSGAAESLEPENLLPQTWWKGPAQKQPDQTLRNFRWHSPGRSV